MDGIASTELPNALQGYDRRAVESFFAAAGTRRARLVNVIAEATARRERAVDAQARNRAIASDARREIDEIRADAERRATQIIVAARLEAQVLLRSAREQAGLAVEEETGPVIDLRGVDGAGFAGSRNGGGAHGGPLSFANLAATSRSEGTFDPADTSDYFAYLRGALPIDTPGTELA